MDPTYRETPDAAKRHWEFLFQELSGGPLRSPKDVRRTGAEVIGVGFAEWRTALVPVGGYGGSHLVGVNQAVARTPSPARVLAEDVSLLQPASSDYFDVVRCPLKLSSIGPYPDRVVVTAVVSVRTEFSGATGANWQFN